MPRCPRPARAATVGEGRCAPSPAPATRPLLPALANQAESTVLQPVLPLPAGQLVGQPNGDASHQPLVLCQVCQGLVRHEGEQGGKRAGKRGVHSATRFQIHTAHCCEVWVPSLGASYERPWPQGPTTRSE
eukprot:9697596-Alexandrium_andersonii.AAC.1